MKFRNVLEKFFFILTFPLLVLVKLLVYFYKFCINPILCPCCKFTPSCSTYFLQALNEYGVFKGSFLGIKRIFRCNPKSNGGLDPVKPNIKGKVKWIL